MQKYIIHHHIAVIIASQLVPCGWSECDGANYELFFTTKKILFIHDFNFSLSFFIFLCYFFFTQAQFLSHTRSQQAVRVTVYIISVEMLLSDGMAFVHFHTHMCRCICVSTVILFMNEYMAQTLIKSEAGCFQLFQNVQQQRYE